MTQLFENHSEQNSPLAAVDRRRFIRKVGGALFAVTLLDIADLSPLPRAAHAAGGCGSGTADASCGSFLDTDQNCGLTKPSGAQDVDESCGGFSKDENCGQAAGATATDQDNNCGSLDTDQNCGKSGPGGPAGTDADQSCSSTSNDLNCQVNQVPAASKDSDANCSATSADADQGCGDCDDNHQWGGDQHCGKTLPAGGMDPDGLCGHQHGASGGITTDQACSATVADAGCGTHTTIYGGTDNDVDEHCVGGATDMHCTAAMGTDANCDAATNPSTTSPDELCSATDVDQACGHYDADESCAATVTDEACGQHFGVFSPNIDTDQNCVANGGANTTDNTNVQHNGPL